MAAVGFRFMEGEAAIPHPHRGGISPEENFVEEIFAIKKGGENVPSPNFGVTVLSFTTAAGIVFPQNDC